VEEWPTRRVKLKISPYLILIYSGGRGDELQSGELELRQEKKRKRKTNKIKTRRGIVLILYQI